MDTTILSPVLAMLCLTFAVWLWMFITRFRYIGANRVDAQDMATPKAGVRFAATSGGQCRLQFS